MFDIVACGLPYADRRALSEAWYASLHIAERSVESPAPLAARRPIAAIATAAMHAPPAGSGTASPARSSVHTVGLKSRAAAMLGAQSSERRRPPLGLATRIAKTFTRTLKPASATFDIEHDGQRVRVMMRRDAGNVRLIALCNPAVRTTVARALDEARFLLAARGVAVYGALTKAVPA